MYLSADVPRWIPRIETDLQAAIDGGLLEESHYLDLKRDIAPKAKGNRELARDLAQFAIDGGLLIVGVEEHKDGTPHELHPVELADLPERIEQVARSAIDPPLAIRCHPIPSTDNPAKGYLVVEVPISPSAPHMVDGVYLGRGELMRERLSDAQVLRLHQRRAEAQTDAQRLLEAYVEHDPIPAGDRRNAHFFAVAFPVMPRSDEMLLEHAGEDWDGFFEAAIRAACSQHSMFPPTIAEARLLSRRSDGMARTQALTQERTSDGRLGEKFTVEVEFSEAGAVRIFNGRLSDELETADLSVVDRSKDERQILSEIAVGATRHLLEVVRFVADRVGYTGSWHVGVAATGIAGLYARPGPKESHDLVGAARRWRYEHVYSPARYPSDEDTYSRTCAVSLLELQQTPGATAKKLLGRLLRTLAVEDRYDLSLADIADVVG